MHYDIFQFDYILTTPSIIIQTLLPRKREMVYMCFIFLLLSRVQVDEAAIYDRIFEKADKYELPNLPYHYNGLEPYLDERTLIVHHQGHHKAYTDKMNTALQEWREKMPHDTLVTSSIFDILKRLDQVPEKWQTALKNNGGGYVNHIFYWATMCPIPNPPPASLTNAIEENFPGGIGYFFDNFTSSAKSLFGSGYVWLVQDKEENLYIIQTKDQDCPVTQNMYPLLVLDVWEHAYYLKHENKRPHYIEDWWNVVCWQEVENLRLFWQETLKVNKEHSEL